MKTLAAAALHVATFICMTAQGATRVDTEGFSFAVADSQDLRVSMSLLSNDDGIIRIALENLIAHEGSTQDDWQTSQDIAFVGLTAPGYRITSLSLRGTFFGEIRLTSPAGWENAPGNAGIEPGRAYASSEIRPSIDQAGVHQTLRSVSAINLNGSQAFQTGYWGTLAGEFVLDIYSQAVVGAQAERIWELYPDGSGIAVGEALATIRADNVVLSVNVAPIPEPATYGMLVGGLSVLGFAARRHQRPASNARANCG